MATVFPNRQDGMQHADCSYSLRFPGQPTAMVTDGAWQHDMFNSPAQAAVAGVSTGRAAASGIETGTKLYISNLDFGVSQDDVKVRVSRMESFCGSNVSRMTY